MLLSLAAGCRPQDEIAQYTVPKQHLVDAKLSAVPTDPSQKQQMLAAIILVEDAGWFFKLTGDQDIVTTLEDPFNDFIKELKFTAAPQREPQWKLPADWKQRGPEPFRFATLEIPAAGQVVELAVSTFPKTSGSDEDYVLRNVNRWRGQLGLSELEANELAANLTTLEVDGLRSMIVNFTGASPGSKPASPLASGLPPVGSTNEGSGQTIPELNFKQPEGWTKAPPKAFSLATFTAGEGDNRVEITVSSAGGDLLANVNRWRGQVELPPVDADELTASATKIETLGGSGDYVQLVGPSKTILGVVATAGRSQYFVKLIGDSDVAQRERANFEAFVKSLQLK